jgi:hypothetical protein
MLGKTSQISRLRTYGVGELLMLILVSVFSVLAELPFFKESVLALSLPDSLPLLSRVKLLG